MGLSLMNFWIHVEHFSIKSGIERVDIRRFDNGPSCSSMVNHEYKGDNVPPLFNDEIRNKVSIHALATFSRCGED